MSPSIQSEYYKTILTTSSVTSGASGLCFTHGSRTDSLTLDSFERIVAIFSSTVEDRLDVLSKAEICRKNISFEQDWRKAVNREMITLIRQ